MAEVAAENHAALRGMSGHPLPVRLQRRDYGLVVAWTLLFLIAYAGLMTAHVLLDPGIQWVLPWKLAGISVLLVFAAQRGHYALVLGLASMAYLLQDFPLYGLCFVMVSAVCYTSLHYAGKWGPGLFWGALVLLVIVAPKCLTLLHGHKTGRPDWYIDVASTGLFLRYAYYYYEWRRGMWERPDYFKHLGYIAFIPQIIANLNYSPSQQWNGAGDYPVVFRRGLQLLGLALLKIICFRLLLHFGPADSGTTPATAWLYVLLNYLKWFLWLSGGFDLCVVFCRFLGADIPPNFHYPLLATSPIEHWRRWNIFNRVLLLKFIYFPLGGSRRHRYRNVAAVFTASAFLLNTGWLGSADPSSIYKWALPWLAYALAQAGWVIANMEWRRRRGLDSHHQPCGFAAVAGWAATFATMAWLHVLILGQAHPAFPGDSILTWPDRLHLFARGMGL